jgi:Xaa-Pro aminopeptidase
MFQSFDVKSDPSQGLERVARLRKWLEKEGLDGFLVPRADEHQGEYVAQSSERLSWLTGFTGSAGAALVLKDKALLFVDGRYTLQARHQTDPSTFSIESLVDNPPDKWLAANLAKGSRIGFDPWLHTISEAEKLRMAVAERGGGFVAVEHNPIDALWSDRPGPPLEPVEIQPEEFAGRLAKEKLADTAEAIAKGGASHTILTDPSSLAWVFNIRGHDVPHTPLALGFAILGADGRHRLFLDERKLSIKVKAYLTQLADLFAPGTLEDELARLAKSGASVGLDPVLTAEKLRLLSRKTAARWCISPIRHACPAPSRTRPRSPAPAPRIAATARPSRNSLPGSTGSSRTLQTRSLLRKASRNFVARPAKNSRCRCATSPSTRSPAPGRTAPSSTIA